MKSNKPKKRVAALQIIVIIILVFTNIYTLFFYKISSNSFSVQDKYSFLNLIRNFYRKDDLIVNFQPLREYLNDKYEADPNVSIYFEYLPTGANIAISKDAEFYPASLLKIPIAMAAAKKIEKGDWKWTNELVLMSADKDDKFGNLYKEKTNSTHTIEDLVKRSLSQSDNTAHFILIRNLETSEIEDVYNHIGLAGFLKTDGKLSTKRYSVIFRSLYNSSYLSEENSQKLLSFLAQSDFKDFIENALPKNIIFSHKIGISDDQKVFLDSGIIFKKDRPYLLTVMIKDKNEKLAKEIMRDISEKVYNYINNYSEKND